MIKLTDFCKNDFVNFASYNNMRQIASYIDGCKNANRKIIHTAIKQNITNFTRVDQFSARMQLFTEYLHGSADGSVINLTQNFVGSNNMPLLEGDGNFGVRFDNTPAASRYIKVRKHSNANLIFNPDDDNILIKQEFEGTQIEPKFYLPILPLILINGSNGVSSGFAQNILPRNIKDIKKNIIRILEGKKQKKMLPFWNDFSTNNLTHLVEDTDNSYYIYGTFNKIRKHELEITEIPIGYSLKKYVSILDKLEDTGKIKSYEDLSNRDKFKFKVFVKTSFFETNDTDFKVLDTLKLIKRVSENFTCLDENNRIIEFKSAEEILEKFVKFRLNQYSIRKEFMIEKYNKDISKLKSKVIFIKGILDDTIIIKKKSKAQIEKQLENIKDIIKINDNFDYLLNMKIHSLTKEKVTELIQQLKDFKLKLKNYKKISPIDIWKSEMF